MNADTRAFAASYGQAFAAFLARHDERNLRIAYELGREAVMTELSVLDLAVVHHDVLAAALAGAAEPDAATVAARDFFLEALSAYEMVRRGFRDARDAAALERRQADLLRQLSNFLADASLALGASDSLEEMLQLVAEQARELMQAETCRVELELERRSRVAAVSADVDTWSQLPQAEIASAAGNDAEQGDEERRTLRQPLSTLDGRPMGFIEVSARNFTELDATVLAQLGQMASAAVERRLLYRKT